MKKILYLFSKYVKEKKTDYIIYLILDLIATVLVLILPQITKKAIDALINGKDSLLHIYRILLIYAIVSIIYLIINYISSKLYVLLESNLTFRLNLDLIKHVQNISLSYTNTCSSTYLTNRLNTDSNIIVSFSINFSKNLLKNTLSVIIIGFYLLKLDAKVFLSVLLLIFLYSLIYLLMKKKIYKIVYELKEKQSIFFSDLESQINGLEYIKSQSLYDKLTNKLKISFYSLMNQYISNNRINYLYGSLDSIVNTFSTVFLLMYFGNKILNKSMTLGVFNVLLSYFNIVIGSIQYFFDLGNEVQNAKASYERIHEIFNIHIESNGDKRLDKINNIIVDNLSFSYNEADLVLDKINYFFEEGMIYIIKGLNGSGKTTFINLLIGLYIDEYKGEIKYNRINIKELDMKTLRKQQIGILNQKVDMFDINFIEKAMKINKPESIKLFRGLGIEYIYDEFSDNSSCIYDIDKLSVGERQKLNIIELILRNPDVLILDEPTSAMDLKSKNYIIKVLKEIAYNKIIIIINHDELLDNLPNKIINFNEI